MSITQQKFDYIRLARSKNIGSINFFRLLDICKTPKQALEEIIDSQHKNFNQNIKLASVEEVEKEIQDSEKFSAKIITFFDDEYPFLLKEIADPPPVISVKGDLELLKEQNNIAIVGARNASLNGMSFTNKIAHDLGAHNVKIVSGMAHGIDKSAHEYSLKSGTIAVIAGGIDNIYPKENRNLYHKISEMGLLISEQPFGSSPLARNFIRRNRIISGLSQGVVVMEAGVRSGSLATANFAANQGRQVFAVPGAPYNHRSMGCNKLIKEGAKIVENVNDILEEIQFVNNDADKSFKTKMSENESSVQPVENISEYQNKILSILDFDGVDIDYIVTQTKIAPETVKSSLMELEIMQKIYSNNGKISLKSSS